MLRAHGKLPIVAARPPSLERLRVVGRPEDIRPEVRVGHRQTFTVGRRVRKVAIRNEILISVDPVPRGAGDEVGDGIPERRARGAAAGLPVHVLVESNPNGGLAGPKQIVDSSHPRRDVFPVHTHGIRNRQVPVGCELHGQQRLTWVLRLQPVISQPPSERQTLHSPSVLRIQSDQPTQLPRVVVRRRPKGHLIRNPVIEAICELMVGAPHEIHEVGIAASTLDADLQRAGTSDV